MKTIIKPEKVIYPELSFKINGVLFKVRKNLGQFRNEQQYCDTIEEEFKSAGIKYEREKVLLPAFSGEEMGRNRLDFLVEGVIALEVKAKQFVTKEDYYQVQRYLVSSGIKLAVVVNMRRYYVQPKRILNINPKLRPGDEFTNLKPFVNSNNRS